MIYLDQAWSQADREAYYQAQQGSQVIAYDIFLNLEVANGQELFRSDANSDRYGLITQAPNPRTNPDGLPIGLTKTVMTEGRWKGETVGVTCSACHNAQLTYQGKKIRIDGGFNHTFDFMAYMFALDDAMQATLTDAAKFDRLAARIGRVECRRQDRAAQALRKRCGARARLPRDHDGHARRLGTWPHRRLQPDHQSHAGHGNRHRRKLVVADGACQASVRVECAPRVVDAMVRHRAGPDRSQPWRNAGRVSADGLSFQDAARGPLRVGCDARRPQQDRAPAGSPGTSQMAGGRVGQDRSAEGRARERRCS